MRGRVVSVSDRAAAGEYEDRSGPLAAELLGSYGVSVDRVEVVPDDLAAVAAAVRAGIADGLDVCVTTGGTGIGPRDVTPEAVGPLLDRSLPGLAEALRQAFRDRVPTSVLSRGVAGVAGSTCVVTLPGSTGGVRDGIGLFGPLLEHVIAQLAGGTHEPAEPGAAGR